MSTPFFQTIQKALESPLTLEAAEAALSHIDFFFKILTVKYESQDSVLQAEAEEEIKEFRALLENATKKMQGLTP